MHILIATPLWPNAGHTVRGGNIILHEMARVLAGSAGVRVTVQVAALPEGAPRNDQESAACEELARDSGVAIAPEFRLRPDEVAPARADRWRILFPRVSDYYAQWPARERWQSHVLAQKPDAVIILLSSWLTALSSGLAAPTYAYYGNPDAKSRRRRDDFSLAHRRFGRIEYWKRRWDMAHLERYHLAIMRGITHCGNVSANDAGYYHAHRHPRAFYVPHLWPENTVTDKAFSREPKPGPVRIIANIGKLDGTANRDGLLVLGAELLPRFPVGRFQWEILGANRLDGLVRSHLERDDVHLRGWVPDIDGEMAAAHIFLCTNNASPYKVGHTRYLHAMSLGCCIVAHADVRLSMPELVHDQNCLLGNSIEEMAALIEVAAGDSALRARLGRNALADFARHFTGPAVVPQIVAKLGAPGPLERACADGPGVLRPRP